MHPRIKWNKKRKRSVNEENSSLDESRNATENYSDTSSIDPSTIISNNISQTLLNYFSGPSDDLDDLPDEDSNGIPLDENPTQLRYEITDVDSDASSSETDHEPQMEMVASTSVPIITNEKINSFAIFEKHSPIIEKSHSKNSRYLSFFGGGVKKNAVDDSSRNSIDDYYRLLRTGNSEEDEPRYHHRRYWGLAESDATASNEITSPHLREAEVKNIESQEITEHSDAAVRVRRDSEDEPNQRREHRRNVKRKRSGSHRKKKGGIGM